MSEPAYSRLGCLLKNARRDKGLTLDALAAHVGVTAGALSHIESGRRLPDPKNAIRIAAALGLSEDEVLSALDAEHANRRRSQAYGTDPSEFLGGIVSATSMGDMVDRDTFEKLPIEALFAATNRPMRAPVTGSVRNQARWSEDAQARLAAAETLADQAAVAIRTLKGLLEDKDPAVRAEARRLLRELDVRTGDE